MATSGSQNKKSAESRHNTGAVERLTDLLKTKRFLDEFETLSENQQEGLLPLLHGAVEGNEGKGKKIKKKGEAIVKQRKRQRLTVRQLRATVLTVFLRPQPRRTSPPLLSVVTLIRLHQVRTIHQLEKYYSQSF